MTTERDIMAIVHTSGCRVIPESLDGKPLDERCFVDDDEGIPVLCPEYDNGSSTS